MGTPFIPLMKYIVSVSVVGVRVGEGVGVGVSVGAEVGIVAGMVVDAGAGWLCGERVGMCDGTIVAVVPCVAVNRGCDVDVFCTLL
ncbi:MAG TPA: hypothetical protein DDW33_02880 [Ktedonobacter sp.]|nr:hypothetical protein [Ktedonobacter sp.]HBE24617.1 hypothetical protein [Ktedonobacter sp.]HCF87374.1 hypothetical protein [Ktedonobacter sp.]HCJ36537.1 hypothetical protein [Ktedonobacter sp.]